VIMFETETARNRNLMIRRKATLVHQKPILFSTTVRNNIAFGLRASGHSSKEVRNRVQWAAEELKLEELLETHARRLSGGEAQRVVLARALVLDAPILLLDEPTNSLDDASRPMFFELLKKTHQIRNNTILVATHDLDFIEPLADCIIRLADGKIMQQVNS
jgi:tungstate transport system ATP-binding protein